MNPKSVLKWTAITFGTQQYSATGNAFVKKTNGRKDVQDSSHELYMNRVTF